MDDALRVREEWLRYVAKLQPGDLITSKDANMYGHLASLADVIGAMGHGLRLASIDSGWLVVRVNEFKRGGES